MNPYSGTSSLAKMLRFAAVSGGIVYGSFKLGYLKSVAASNAAKNSSKTH